MKSNPVYDTPTSGSVGNVSEWVNNNLKNPSLFDDMESLYARTVADSEPLRDESSRHTIAPIEQVTLGTQTDDVI